MRHELIQYDRIDPGLFTGGIDVYFSSLTSVEWEEWLPWGSCDQLTCRRRRFRKCTCSDGDGVHLEDRCVGDSSQSEMCETGFKFNPQYLILHRYINYRKYENFTSMDLILQ